MLDAVVGYSAFSFQILTIAGKVEGEGVTALPALMVVTPQHRLENLVCSI